MGWLLSALGFAAQGQWIRRRLALPGLWGYIRCLDRTLAKRQRVQASRVVSERELFKSIAYSPPMSYYVNRLRRALTQGLHG